MFWARKSGRMISQPLISSFYIEVSNHFDSTDTLVRNSVQLTPDANKLIGFTVFFLDVGSMPKDLRCK